MKDLKMRHAIHIKIAAALSAACLITFLAASSNVASDGLNNQTASTKGVAFNHSNITSIEPPAIAVATSDSFLSNSMGNHHPSHEVSPVVAQPHSH